MCVLCFGNPSLALKLLLLQLWEQKFLRFAGGGVTLPRDSSVQGKDLWGGDISGAVGFLGAVSQMDLFLLGALMEPCGVQVAGTVLPQSLVADDPREHFCLFAPLHLSLMLTCAAWFYPIGFIGPVGHRRGSRGQNLGVKWQFCGSLW